MANQPPNRLLVTGAHGFVAGSVIHQAGDRWEVHAVSRGTPLLERPGLCWHRVDLTVPRQLEVTFLAVRPHAVIHTAAMADIDRCESDQRLALRVNVGLTRDLAQLCSETRSKLVFCSTDNVFSGKDAPYREEDPRHPVNYYGVTKVEAEKYVFPMFSRGVMARLALVMGFPLLGAGNSFLPRLVAALKAGQEVGVPANEIRTPIDAITAGRALLELAAEDHYGFFHLAGNESLSRFDMARRIAIRLGLPTELIVANDPTTIPDRAARPRDVSLDNSKARRELKTPMLGLDDALALIVATEGPGQAPSPQAGGNV